MLATVRASGPERGWCGEKMSGPQYALYAANLIHQDTHAVIKVVRYGINLACFPNEHTVGGSMRRRRVRKPIRIT
jgi:hypothetical protein